MTSTRRKLDLFYEHITDLYYNQKSNSPDVLNYWNEHILDDSSNLWQSTLLKDFEEDDKSDFISIREIDGFDDDELRSLLSEVAADISAEEKNKQDRNKKVKKEEKDLETALNDALADLTTEDEKNVKPIKVKVDMKKQTLSSPSHPRKKRLIPSFRPKICRRRSYWYPDMICLSGEPPQSPLVIKLIGLPHNQPIDQELKRKLSSLHFNKQARRKNREEKAVKSEDKENSVEVKSEEKDKEDRIKYTRAYRDMEFLPYHALPLSLEEAIFLNRGTPLADYDDPYWPTKLHCLQLVESSGNLPKFTGTFLTPEARGVSFEELFAAVSTPLPPTLQQLPRCVDIVELPLSMSALDHLEGVAKRHIHNQSNEHAAEKGLLKILLSTVEAATHADHTPQEAVRMVFAALMKHGSHWALFNLASLYWRSIGDGLNTIECLRRAIHFAPNENKDIGYIGLANTLQRHGYLNDAVLTARAALEIRPDSAIGHYTLASSYLSSGNMIATSLHLRMSLHIQPNFGHALSALKLVMCSLKFKEEQRQLEHKQQLLIAEQEMLKESGGQVTPEAVREAVSSRVSDHSDAAVLGDESVAFLTKLAIAQRRMRENDGRSERENISPSHSLQLKAADDRMKETNSIALKSKNSPKSDDLAELTRKLARSVSAAISEISPAKQTYTPTKRTPPSTPTKKPRYTMEFMAKESAREEELRKQWPDYLPWPTLEDCQQKPPSRYIVFTSTWLSVTAKKINISDYVDFNSAVEDYSLLPFCENTNDSEASMNILEHLEGMTGPPLVNYIAERGLEEVLCKLEGTYRSLEELATRIKLTMDKNDNSWVLYNLAALYWRIVGDGQQAIKCLKLALSVSSPTNKDVALVSLANVLYRSGYYKDSAIAMQMALETSPNLVVNHFTMANILAAQAYYREAAGYYEVVLYHQPEFGPAADRLRTVRCMIVLGEHKLKQQQLQLQQQIEEHDKP